jgi:hypothetical protein
VTRIGTRYARWARLTRSAWTSDGPASAADGTGGASIATPSAVAIATAARLPSAAARTIDAGPCPETSPAAYTPRMDDSRVEGSAAMQPAGVSVGG